MLVQKRQYRVNQILILNIEVDIFDNKIPDAKHIEELVAFSIMENKDTKIKEIRTSYLCIEDKTI